MVNSSRWRRHSERSPSSPFRRIRKTRRIETDRYRNLATARRYVAALEGQSTGEALAQFFTVDVLQEEFPNRLVPTGARRELADILEASDRGRQVMAAQKYEIVHAVADGDDVVLEVEWTGTLSIPLGSLAAGAQLTARLAVFLEFRDGKIARQRNYDCFQPW